MIETVWPPFMVFKGLKMEIEKLYSYLARPKNKNIPEKVMRIGQGVWPSP